MNPTTTINVEQNYYGLLSMDEEEYNADDATVVTSNKSTDSSIYVKHIPTMISNSTQEANQHNLLEILPTPTILPTKAKA